MKTEEKMLHILEKNCADALESGILVALSGGADSCALALLLKNLSCKIVEKHTNFRLCCAHFNHCIRGDMTFLNAQGFKAEWDLLQQLIICRTMRKAYCCIFSAEAGLTGCAE